VTVDGPFERHWLRSFRLGCPLRRRPLRERERERERERDRDRDRDRETERESTCVSRTWQWNRISVVSYDE